MPDSTVVNWAEVADKALETGASAVAELSELVKSVAPEVWEIAIRQVYADAIGNFVGFFTALICVVCVGLLSRKRMTTSLKGYDSGGAEIILIIGGVLSVGLTLFTVLTGAVLIKTLINPSYYTIKLITDMI